MPNDDPTPTTDRAGHVCSTAELGAVPKRTKLTPYQKIARAVKCGTGVRLTPADVYALQFDDAVMSRARNDDDGASLDA